MIPAHRSSKPDTPPARCCWVCVCVKRAYDENALALKFPGSADNSPPIIHCHYLSGLWGLAGQMCTTCLLIPQCCPETRPQGPAPLPVSSSAHGGQRPPLGSIR